MTDWDMYSRTKGKDVHLIGAGVSEERRRMIREAFGFASLTVVDPGKIRLLKATEEKVYQGSVDLVIHLTSYSGHSADDIVIAACKQTDTPFLMVDEGHNPTRIRHSFEQQFGQSIR